jgi:hypothetical protein
VLMAMVKACDPALSNTLVAIVEAKFRTMSLVGGSLL